MINTNTATVQKHQLLDYVSKREFNDFVGDMREFREVTVTRFDQIDVRFETIERRLSGIDKQILTLNKNIDQFREDVRVQIGAALEQFKEHLDLGLEYMQNVEDKKVDKREFEKLEERVNKYMASRKSGKTIVG